MAFDTAFHHIVLVEGGYGHHPSDPGGATKYGITEAVARANGYDGAMQDLSLQDAKAIYRKSYWAKMWLDEVAVHSDAVADRLFDIGVNTGTGQAIKWLQRALNAMNRQEQLYPDVEVDGGNGPNTLAALRQYLAHRGTDGETVLLRALNAQLGNHYLSIAKATPALEAFVFGWFLNRVQ